MTLWSRQIILSWLLIGQHCTGFRHKIHSIVTAMMWKISWLTGCRLKGFEFDRFYVVDQRRHLLCSVHLTVRSTLKQRDTSKMHTERETERRIANMTDWQELPHQCWCVSLDLEWVPLPPLLHFPHLPDLEISIKKIIHTHKDTESFIHTINTLTMNFHTGA